MTAPDAQPPIDAVCLLGFGGPSSPDEVMPFLRRVVAGRGIPDERLTDVARHYAAVGGRSPYNEITYRQAIALERRLAASGLPVRVYVGFRHTPPFIADVVRRMAADGVRQAAGIVLAAHRSEASRDRYVADADAALASVRDTAGDSSGAVGCRMTYVEPWFDDPHFFEAHAELIEMTTPHRRGAWPAQVPLLFTAHSIPQAMADRSPYVSDLTATARGIAAVLGAADWELAWQSRSGDPETPWLEPDVNDVLRRRAATGTREVVVQAIGFLSDHVEVLYDLDREARATAVSLGLAFRRAPCVNDHPTFIALLADRVLVAAGRAPSRV